METINKNGVKRSVRIGKAIGTAALLILSFLAFLAFFSANWYISTYGRTGFDSVIYTLTGGLGGVQSGLVYEYLAGALLPTVLCTLLVYLLLFGSWVKNGILPLKRWLSVVVTLALSLGLLTHAAFNVGLVDYFQSRRELSQLYETEYVDPNSVAITFPEEKRNLIYIYLESMETSYLSTEEGGAMETNLIPELFTLAQENINFSHNSTVGGLVEVPGASWTVGAMVAQTSGVPLVTPSNVSDWQNGYGKEGVFLPGLTTLSNILHDNGYYQALMVGSDANFGGRKTYYATHDVDTVYDVYTARKDGIIPNDYFVWWGMEDLHLFEYAKQELLEISQMDQPFAFTMLTVDTHHIGGYTCQLCGSAHEESYENVISCSSKQVLAFVQWIMEQDFYENTTVIITGDHFSMDSGYFSRVLKGSYVRHGYNCFINAPVTPFYTENRQFSSLDMFPTTLAALGCTIDGERLGLGVNLFSNVPTLIEYYGYSAFCAELSKRTEFYESNFYYE